MTTVLRTPAAVIDALGGTANTAKWLGRKRSSVGMWKNKHRNRIPAIWSRAINQALAAQGKFAAPEVFKMPANGASTNGARKQKNPIKIKR